MNCHRTQSSTFSSTWVLLPHQNPLPPSLPILTVRLYFTLLSSITQSHCHFPCYRTEVARTRLREEGHKYRRFFQTIFLVYREEGIRNGLYRGLCTQLLRNIMWWLLLFTLLLTMHLSFAGQIPNTAIMMGTYEVVVSLMTHLPVAPMEQI